MNLKYTIPSLLFTLGILSGCSSLHAEPTSAPAMMSEMTMNEAVALGGYSPVSYLESGKAEKGNPRIFAELDGQTYRFVSNSQRDAFLANPQKYLPAFDGYCAYGVAKGAKFETNPTTFKVVDGRTFLYLNNGETNTLELWNKENENDLTRTAYSNWDQVNSNSFLEHYLVTGNEKLGIQGYSPVSYFTQGKAIKGDPQYTATFKGVKYQFADAAEMETFKKNPTKYEPAYGGWCATGMMLEQKFPINPKTFKIVEGKLFLFKNDETVNALDVWNQGNEAEEITKANAFWSELTTGK